jgi:glycosyltransferase involved in cell wall biosynthesis
MRDPQDDTLSGAKRLISVVSPVYNEEGNIDELARQLVSVFESQPGYDFEVILVENGSSDGTWDHIQAACAADRRFKSIRLSRNFTPDGGVSAGLTFASGDAAVIMCADLQDPPELIKEFIARWEQGYENVYQIVTRRTGTGPVRRFNSQVFYWIINAMTGGLFPRNVSDYRLVDRRVYETINGMREHNRFMRGMFYWAGFRSIGVECERAPRYAGESKATTRTVIALAIKGILSYSYLPLRFITYLGMGISFVAFVLLVYEVYRILRYGVPFAGFGTLMTVMLIMFGFLFTMLGVVAEYIGLIYEEVKQRPNFIVKDTLGL